MQNVTQKNLTYEDVKNTVYEVITELLSITDKDLITRDTQLVGDLGVDSLQWVEIFVNIDSKLGINTPEAECEEIDTVGDLLSTVCKLLHIEMPDKDPQPFVKQDKKNKNTKVHKESTTPGAKFKKHRVHKNSSAEQTPEFTDTLHYMMIMHYWSLPVLGSGKINACRFVFRATNPECEDGIIFQTQGNPIFDEEAKLFSSCMSGDIIQVKKRVLHNEKVSPVSYSMVKNISADKRIADFNKNYKKIISKIENGQKQKTK